MIGCYDGEYYAHQYKLNVHSSAFPILLFLLLIFKKWYTLSYLYSKVECDGLFKNINKNNYAIHIFLNIMFFVLSYLNIFF